MINDDDNMSKLCKFCGTKNESISEYCISCGQKLNDKIEIKQPEPKYSKPIEKIKSYKPNWTMWTIIAVLMFIAIVLVLPTTVNVPYQRLETYQEPYTDKEAYDIQVPYTTQEVVTTTEPYQEQVQIDGSVISATQDMIILISSQNTIATFIIKNNDMDIGGDFTIIANFVPSVNVNIGTGSILSTFVPGLPSINFDILKGGTKSGSIYIAPRSTGKIIITTGALYQVKGYDLIRPTKTITKYRQVSSIQSLTKYRTETQYRDVIKTRPAQRYVTDYKSQSVMLFQKILGIY